MIARLISLFFITFAQSANAQEQKVPSELPANGTELFRGLLNLAGIEPATPDEPYAVRGQPNQLFQNRIIIVYGKPKTATQDKSIRSLIALTTSVGGSVLFATGEKYDLSSIHLQTFQKRILFTGLGFYGDSPLTPDELPREQKHECPFVSSKPFGFENLVRPDTSADWNPFRGFARIATRRPGVITEVNNTEYWPGDTLAYLPPGCRTSRFGQTIPTKATFARKASARARRRSKRTRRVTVR